MLSHLLRAKDGHGGPVRHAARGQSAGRNQFGLEMSRPQLWLDQDSDPDSLRDSAKLGEERTS